MNAPGRTESEHENKLLNTQEISSDIERLCHRNVTAPPASR